MVVLNLNTTSFSKETKIEYSQNNISDYLSGIISAEQGYTDEAFDYLNKVQLLKKSHKNYNIQFIRTLILLEKFNEAFEFSKKH